MITDVRVTLKDNLCILEFIVGRKPWLTVKLPKVLYDKLLSLK